MSQAIRQDGSPTIIVELEPIDGESHAYGWWVSHHDEAISGASEDLPSAITRVIGVLREIQNQRIEQAP
jgi:redox-sensitive bicupin YhaK (pirin superfamily)